MANRHRPRRGPAGSNILVKGDTGTTAGPQGGAKPGASESGDLQSREFGVPQADIPGGLRHKVNPEARPAETTAKPERPADYHKYHGVPSDDGQYAETPGIEHDKPRRPAPEPKFADAVPVYVVEHGGDERKIRTLSTSGPYTIPANDTAPRRIADRDPNRKYVQIQIENGTYGVALRVGLKSEVDIGIGMYVPGGSSWREIETQDELWAINAAGAGTAVSYSIGYITDIAAEGS